MCEYSHAMGNSNGCLADYWDAIERPRACRAASSGSSGTTACARSCPTAPTSYAYGGDFGDEPNDVNFCIDGVVWPDRTPKPALYEHQYLACADALRASHERLKRGG